jgi:ribosomal protein L7/L12
MLNQKALEYLKDLIIKDLANHFNGDPQSLMSANDLEFTLSSEDIDFRRSLLKHIIALQQTSQNTPIQLTVPMRNDDWHRKINEADARSIARSLSQGRKIEAIKTLRQATGFGLKEAKDIIDSFLPSEHSQLENYRQEAKDRFLARCIGGLFVNKPWQRT